METVVNQMATINLFDITRGEVSVLLGYDYGTRVREYFKLDSLDAIDEPVELVLPPDLDTIAPSFVQGFFGMSALAFRTKEKFFEHYRFSGWPEDLLVQVDAGISRALMNRSNAVSH